MTKEAKMSVPDMSGKASEITDPHHLIERIAYRDELMLENIHKGMKNAEAEIEIMVGHNAAELHQLAKLID
jgi:hypothetical protein